MDRVQVDKALVDRVLVGKGLVGKGLDNDLEVHTVDTTSNYYTLLNYLDYFNRMRKTRKQGGGPRTKKHRMHVINRSTVRHSLANKGAIGHRRKLPQGNRITLNNARKSLLYSRLGPNQVENRARHVSALRHYKKTKKRLHMIENEELADEKEFRRAMRKAIKEDARLEAEELERLIRKAEKYMRREERRLKEIQEKMNAPNAMNHDTTEMQQKAATIQHDMEELSEFMQKMKV